jgi:hypothetical protein
MMGKLYTEPLMYFVLVHYKCRGYRESGVLAQWRGKRIQPGKMHRTLHWQKNKNRRRKECRLQGALLPSLWDMK